MLLGGQLIWFSFLILNFLPQCHSPFTCWIPLARDFNGTLKLLFPLEKCCNFAQRPRESMEQWAGSGAGRLHADQSTARVPLWSIATAFCMLLNVIALWAQSHHGFCKCRETHWFADLLFLGGVGKNKYISALMKSSLERAVWLLWICPPFRGCIKGMNSLVVHLGVAVL